MFITSRPDSKLLYEASLGQNRKMEFSRVPRGNSSESGGGTAPPNVSAVKTTLFFALLQLNLNSFTRSVRAAQFAPKVSVCVFISR